MFAVVGVVDVVCVHYSPFILGKTAEGYLLLDNCGTVRTLSCIPLLDMLRYFTITVNQVSQWNQPNE